ncbi:MAG: hypothetical protein OES26_20940 [Gammaproteobacteria bacterium]|nr:hypothetical protein [Gammaproteobacteria bacterium]
MNGKFRLTGLDIADRVQRKWLGRTVPRMLAVVDGHERRQLWPEPFVKNSGLVWSIARIVTAAGSTVTI